MLESDAFDHIRARLGMDRQDDLARVQAILDEWYPDMLRAKRWHRGTLTVTAANSPVASEIRMRQVELIERSGLEVVRLQIQIIS